MQKKTRIYAETDKPCIKQSSTINHLSSLSIQNHHSNFNVIRSYLTRPIAALSSEMRIGQLNSGGLFFSGLPYQGIHLRSDERMLPPSQRGYAPIVQGIAKSLARVSISQHGREIYQTTVAPGPFKITDLYPTSYNGDLTVVHEANGEQASFQVPFSAVPESVRPGRLKYHIDFGKTHDLGDDRLFGSATAQYGVNNAFTLNSGVQLAEDYQALMLGSAWSNRFGAMSADLTYSNAMLPDQGRTDGYMLGLSYSKTLAHTNTTFALAGYHYSTEGFYDLANVIQLNEQHTGTSRVSSIHPLQRSRFTASVNQHFGEYGTLSFSGAAQDYYRTNSHDYQLQLAYGKSFRNGMSLNLHIARQNYQRQSTWDRALESDTDTTYGLSVHMPWSHSKPRAIDLSTSYQHNSDGNQYQVNVSGQLDPANSLHYNLGVQHQQQRDQTTFNATLQKRFAYANTQLSTAINDQSWQFSTNVQGAVAIHADGVTLGQYLSDTFALVHAPGAEGAQFSTHHGVKVNRAGYALLPSLTPYQHNRIALNPEGISEHVELIKGEQQVVPMSGVSLAVQFATRQGQAILIHARTPDGNALPLGADVIAASGEIIGVVGQGSQIYFLAETPAAQLKVVWGDADNEQCLLDYRFDPVSNRQPMVKLQSICQGEE